MMEILDAAEASERLSTQILPTVEQATDTWDLDQLCDFAEIYARRGSEEARRILYQVFESRPDASAPWLAEEQIVRLDGMQGFLRAAERQGAEIRRGDWDWEGLHLVSLADERLGAGSVDKAIRQAAKGNLDLRAFLDGLREYRSGQEAEGPSPRDAHRMRMQAIPVDTVIKEIGEPDAAKRRIPFRGWGRYASDTDLLRVQSSMFSETDPGRLANYLRVLSGHALPRFDERLIDLAKHDDPDVRDWALDALKENSHQSIRSFALERLRAGEADGQILGLLARNYRDGDHDLIEAVSRASGDADEMHGLAWALLDIFTENRSANCFNSMTFAYEHTPCALCRARAVELLVEHGVMPEELLAECRFDANEDIRAMARQAGSHSRPT